MRMILEISCAELQMHDPKKAELNCTASGGTYVICNAMINKYSVAIPFNVTAVNKRFSCKCVIQGMFKSVYATGITKVTITKKKVVPTKSKLPLIVTIVGILLLVFLSTVVWFVRRRKNKFDRLK